MEDIPSWEYLGKIKNNKCYKIMFNMEKQRKKNNSTEKYIPKTRTTTTNALSL